MRSQEVAQFDASGKASAVLNLAPSGYRAQILRMVVTSNSASATECKVYMGSGEAVESEYEDGTNSGNGDSAEWQAFYIESGQLVLVQWIGGTVGAYATVRVAYELAERF